ncbi:NADP-dependent 3-hydroxy acid dehydrogenase YdfG [Paenarthrobacter nitroguajacolicus]|uniref:SDR family oxidoreductase n=1 Tax=Paenarthrobacter nitroguajacolicus TaxID=211146 RepID=UPI0028675DF0|nr:SDR family oxidoreductase [Paenarthrobacter nitroguajacolicus]MDR6987063.1 NADP-dependent 3-hydroxy acid dehydrogenase YdfG [Paenarthrobacter nitroguajacolicus]
MTLAEHSRTSGHNPAQNKTAVVTGASTGIGEATVRALVSTGWQVFAVARRAERLGALGAETGAVPFPADITNDDDVAALLAAVTKAGGADTLINIAGGARGADTIANADTEDWEWMYQVNVLGTMKITRAFLPMLREHGEGTVLNLTSTAGLSAYEGGAGYNAAKFAQHAMTNALRLEEVGNNIRVIEVAPGLVQTEEFALNRLGDKDAAAKVYAGVEKPLTAADVADVVKYAVSLPHHINLDEIVVRPVAQAANHKLIRKEG